MLKEINKFIDTGSVGYSYWDDNNLITKHKSMSEIWKLNLNDWTKGLIVAVLASVLQPVLVVLQGGGLVFDWQAILTVGLTAGLAYVLKNLGTNTDGEFVPVAGAKKLFTKK